MSLWNEYYGRLTLANAYKNAGKEDFALQWYQALLKAYPFQQDMLDFWLKDAGINFDQEHQQFIIGLIKKTYTNSEFTNEQLQHAIKRLEELIFPNGKHYFKVPKVPPSSGVELTAIDPALSYLNLKPGDILVAANRYELQTLAQYFLVRIPFTGKMMRFTLWDGKQYRTVSAPLAVWDRTIKVKPFFRTDEQIIQDRITHWEAMADTSLVCNLSNLGLKEIPPALLKLHGLRYLSLRNNKLEELGTDFHKLTSLERVDLSFNDLASFGEELYTLPNIQLINLSNNRLSGTVKLNALPQLKNLNLSSNQITFLTGEISPTLQKLNLSHNHLQEMPAFAKTSIISLDLKSNHFTNMAPNLGKWQKLKSLDLSENEINELPASYSELTNLKILNLSKNEPSIKSSLKHLPKGLKSLYVQNLYLNKIFSILPPLNEIENLKIDQNNLLFLEDFDSHFFPSLKRLSLAGNQIRSLDEKIYSKLVYLDISDNPLDPSFTVKLTQVYKGKLKND